MYFNTQTDRMLTHHKAITKPSPRTQQRTNPQYNKRFSNTMIIIRVITKLPNSEQSYKGKIKTHNYINRQNQSTNDTSYHMN